MTTISRLHHRSEAVDDMALVPAFPMTIGRLDDRTDDTLGIRFPHDDSTIS